ncbi:unnamed protein product, partial [Brenthis ino]
MNKYVVLAIIFMFVAQINYARNIKSTIVPLGDPVKNSTYVTYEELVYILHTRNGIDSARPKYLTPCARAILGCCKGKVINENCSEALHCGAYFFDNNPCDDKFILQALEAARSFYDQFTRDAV